MKKIKICGITNIKDAQASIEFGADYLGFIFADSPRKVTLGQTLKILDALDRNKIQTVGVFMNHKIDFIKTIDAECDFDIIQLHANENIVEYKKALNKPLLKRIDDFANIDNMQAADFLLFDKTKYNGNILKIEEIKNLNISKRYFIAGGLNDENICAALYAAPDAYGVDVSSGIELSPGKKDLFKLRAFISKCRAFKF